MLALIWSLCCCLPSMYVQYIQLEEYPVQVAAAPVRPFRAAASVKEDPPSIPCRDGCARYILHVQRRTCANRSSLGTSSLVFAQTHCAPPITETARSMKLQRVEVLHICPRQSWLLSAMSNLRSLKTSLVIQFNHQFQELCSSSSLLYKREQRWSLN